MDLNPFAALLAVRRDPLIGRVPSALEYELTDANILFGWAIALLVYGKYRTKSHIGFKTMAGVNLHQASVQFPIYNARSRFAEVYDARHAVGATIR